MTLELHKSKELHKETRKKIEEIKELFSDTSKKEKKLRMQLYNPNRKGNIEPENEKVADYGYIKSKLTEYRGELNELDKKRSTLWNKTIQQQKEELQITLAKTKENPQYCTLQTIKEKSEGIGAILTPKIEPIKIKAGSQRVEYADHLPDINFNVPVIGKIDLEKIKIMTHLLEYDNIFAYCRLDPAKESQAMIQFCIDISKVPTRGNETKGVFENHHEFSHVFQISVSQLCSLFGGDIESQTKEVLLDFYHKFNSPKSKFLRNRALTRGHLGKNMQHIVGGNLSDKKLVELFKLGYLQPKKNYYYQERINIKKAVPSLGELYYQRYKKQIEAQIRKIEGREKAFIEKGPQSYLYTVGPRHNTKVDDFL